MEGREGGGEGWSRMSMRKGGEGEGRGERGAGGREEGRKGGREEGRIFNVGRRGEYAAQKVSRIGEREVVHWCVIRPRRRRSRRRGGRQRSGGTWSEKVRCMVGEGVVVGELARRGCGALCGAGRRGTRSVTVCAAVKICEES